MCSKIRNKKINKTKKYYKKRIKGQKIYPKKINKYKNINKEEIKKRTHKIDKSTKLIIVIFIIIISLFISMITIPNISFKDNHLKIRYNTEIQNNDYKANNLFKDYTKKVKVTGNINYKKIGTYKITYKLKFGFITIVKNRNIEVIDDVKPEIKLKGNDPEYVCPNKEYEEPGYTAIDEYDGELTDKVEKNIDKEKIIYTVKDNSGNVNKIIRNIHYEDITKPVISLKGNNEITIYEGNDYQEPGFTATDNCDGDLTKKVEVSSNVKTNNPGTYKIVYKVKDSNNNETQITRTITVKKWSIIRPSQGGSGKSIIYLTFDDGPSEGTTNIILDILKEEGVKATFFVTNFGPDYLIKREFDEGHTVALHTANHNYNYVYANEKNYFTDLNNVSNRVERITGTKSMIIRFPGGSSNTVSKRLNQGIMTRLTNQVKERGYHYFDWNVDSNDAAGAGTNEVYTNVISTISPSRENIVLMHDVKTTTRDALRNIIRTAKQNGYTFQRITYDTVMITHGVNN